MRTRYAGYPTALVFEDRDGERGTAKVEELLWGDELDLQPETDGDFVKVRVRTGEGSKRIDGWMRSDAVVDDPILDITFVDIGQGDGCVVEVPDGRMIVIDAGERDNMMRYLRWRLMFPSAKRPRRIHAAVISHPDKDHYFGFKEVLGMEGVTFDNVYHNGLVERKGKEPLGPLTDGRPRLYTDLIENRAALEALLDADAQLPSRKVYPDMLRVAVRDEKFGNFQMLSRDDGFVPGFGAGDDVSIEVLGPVVETDADGNRGLRLIGSKSSTGKTKNGHSVVFRLRYGNLRVLLGGDLNIQSEKLLLETLVGRPLPKAEAARAEFMAEARDQLEVDVAKSCHHGSADFSALFLDAVNPVATVISSGDDESHSHPRAETIGAIGVASRGERPLVYSTELARSAREAIRDPRQVRREIVRAHTAVVKATKADERRKLGKEVEDRGDPRQLGKGFRDLIEDTIERSVQTFGAIYLRSDGDRAVIGHRFESNRPGKMWDLCQLLPDPDPAMNGRLRFDSRHAGH